MANKLYPPIIENTLPAFAAGSLSVSIQIPFQLNRTVSRDSFKQISLILKNVSNNVIKINEKTTSSIIYDYEKKYYTACFNIGFMPVIGQYYKAQIAFVDTDGNIGYYSSVGIIKCTAEPSISILDLESGEQYNHCQYEYTGKYQQTSDYTEKVYTYRFDIYDEHNNLIETSGDLLHNSSLDTDRSYSIDTWKPTKSLNKNYVYSIKYSIKTINGFEKSSVQYRIMDYGTTDIKHLGVAVSATNNFDEGYVCVEWYPIGASDGKDLNKVRGNFVLVRASSEDGYSSWNEIYRFELINENPVLSGGTWYDEINKKHRRILWRDFTIQQGHKYRYAVQAYNSQGIYSDRLENDEDSYADFEDTFLYDGERQLKVRFNSKVGSFKSTILESKIDTLGGKYPFIFRNGRVEYKEFPVSGLISYISDPEGLFMKDARTVDLVREETISRNADNITLQNINNASTELTAENFYKERQFKMEALTWLSNGKPKLFKSPSEGNYIIRLMNVSLSPEDQVGRMLHNFSATAYEIAECTFNKMDEYGFIVAKEKEYREPKFEDHALKELFDGKKKYDFKLGAYMITFSGVFQDLKIKFTYKDISESETILVSNTTGIYHVPISDAPVTAIELISGNIDDENIKILFGYYDTDTSNETSFINNITMEDIIEERIGTSIAAKRVNLIDEIEDIRRVTGRFYYISIKLRDVIEIYQYDNKYYLNVDKTNEITKSDFKSNNLYKIVNGKGYIDGNTGLSLTSISYQACINNDIYSDLSRHPTSSESDTAGRFESLTNIDNVNYLSIGNGLIASLVYQLKTIEYEVETVINSALYSSKQTYLSDEKSYQTAKDLFIQGDESVSVNDLKSAKERRDKSYKEYINKLDQKLKEVQGGVIYAI